MGGPKGSPWGLRLIIFICSIIVGGAPTGTPLPPPPHGGPKIIGKHQKIYPIKGSIIHHHHLRLFDQARELKSSRKA